MCEKYKFLTPRRRTTRTSCISFLALCKTLPHARQARFGSGFCGVPAGFGCFGGVMCHRDKCLVPSVTSPRGGLCDARDGSRGGIASEGYCGRGVPRPCPLPAMPLPPLTRHGIARHRVTARCHLHPVATASDTTIPRKRCSPANTIHSTSSLLTHQHVVIIYQCYVAQ